MIVSNASPLIVLLKTSKLSILKELFRRNMVHVDISKFLPLKEMATKEFKSELTAISPHQSKPRTKNFLKFLKKEEKFYIDR